MGKSISASQGWIGPLLVCEDWECHTFAITQVLEHTSRAFHGWLDGIEKKMGWGHCQKSEDGQGAHPCCSQGIQIIFGLPIQEGCVWLEEQGPCPSPICSGGYFSEGMSCGGVENAHRPGTLVASLWGWPLLSFDGSPVWGHWGKERECYLGGRPFLSNRAFVPAWDQ